MENNTNRWFYGVEGSWDDTDKLYKKDKKQFIRFLIRLSENDLDTMRSVFDWKKDYVCMKNQDSEARDKVLEYSFDIMEYDNSKSKDMSVLHSVCVCHPDKVDELKEKLIDSFEQVSMKYARGNLSITTQIQQPKVKRGTYLSTVEDRSTKYPVCILSLGRHNENGTTHILLSKMKIPHKLYIEPKEEKQYKEWYNPEYCQLVVAPVNLSEYKMGGSQMRNYILTDNCKDFDRVWMLDDNITNWVRYYQGTKHNIECPEIFTSIEKYVDRHTNIGVASHNFSPLISEGDCRVCIAKNTKCYSSMLVPTTMRFNYKYNEDVLLSIENISSGFTTLSFNHVQYNKKTSGTQSGGNQSIYKEHTQQGYKDKYDYLYSVLKILDLECKLNLKEGKTVDDLISRDTRMVSKEYHHKVDYNCLVSKDISKKADYVSLDPMVEEKYMYWKPK